jgi:hypothetical protein
LVTLAAVAGAIAVGALDYVSHHKGILLKATILAAETGTTVAVIDHVGKLVWYRTFIGKFLRWLWQVLSRSGRGDGGRGESGGLPPRSPYSNDQAQRQEAEQHKGQEARREAQRQTTPRFIEAYMRSWAVSVVESSRTTRFALAHPQPGSASVRTLGSAIALAIGMVFGGLFVLVPTTPALFSALSARISAVPTPIWIVLTLGLLLLLLMYWKQVLRIVIALILLGLIIGVAAATRAVVFGR